MLQDKIISYNFCIKFYRRYSIFKQKEKKGKFILFDEKDKKDIFLEIKILQSISFFISWDIIDSHYYPWLWDTGVFERSIVTRKNRFMREYQARRRCKCTLDAGKQTFNLK